MLDGFGEEQAPGSAVQCIACRKFFPHSRSVPQHPPGYYGSEGFKHAFNLGSFAPASRKCPTEYYRVENTMKPGFCSRHLLAAAFILLLVDFVLEPLVARHCGFRAARPARYVDPVGGLSACMPATPPAMKRPRSNSPPKPISLISKPATARSMMSPKRGCKGLRVFCKDAPRSIRSASPALIPIRDELVFFPLLYWPLNPARSRCRQKRPRASTIIFAMAA